MRTREVLVLASAVALASRPLAARAHGVPDCPAAFEDLSGVATYYAADGTGACMFDVDPGRMVTAVALPDWAGSAHCGQCLEVWGPIGHVVVRVVDQCPECESGHLDLSAEAFAAIADPIQGIVPVAFRSIECPAAGNLAIEQKDGSNAWWLALQVRNHRYAVARMEVRQNGSATWQTLPRQDYNYFVVTDSGSGLSLPLDLRITDLHGHVVLENDLVTAIVPGQVTAGTSQFPACSGIFLDGFESHTLAPLWTSAVP